MTASRSASDALIVSPGPAIPSSIHPRDLTLSSVARTPGKGERQRAGRRGSEGEGERQRAGGRGSEGEGERQRAGGRGSEGEGGLS
jgi:hypothetical protein